jgi:hypothetical protein
VEDKKKGENKEQEAGNKNEGAKSKKENLRD